MLKYRVEEKFLIQGVERTIINRAEIVIVSFPEKLHWLNPTGKSLTENERGLFVQRLHGIFNGKNLAHEIRMFSELPDHNLFWFYGYGENNFFRVFSKINLQNSNKFILAGEDLLVTIGDSKFMAPVDRLKIDGGLFTKKLIPIFLMDSSTQGDVALEVSTQIMLAENIRAVLSEKDCSFSFRFKSSNSNPLISFNEFLSGKNVDGEGRYRVV